MSDFERARRVMVETQLITSGITDKRLLLAMLEVPRERFVPAERRSLAYIDTNLPIAPDRTMAPAATLAKLLQLAEISHTDRILVVGAATGYSAAVLRRLGASVAAVERDTALTTAAREALAGVGMSDVTIFTGAPDEGLKAQAPYDVILVDGLVDQVPKALLGQLADGGRLVAVLRSGATGIAHLFVRAGKDVAARSAFNAVLPPLAAAREDAFVF